MRSRAEGLQGNDLNMLRHGAGTGCSGGSSGCRGAVNRSWKGKLAPSR